MPRLHEAVAAGDLEIVKSYLHAGDDVDMFSYVMLNARFFYSFFSTAERFKMTPLHLAVHINNSEMVDLLLEKGASLTIAGSVYNDHTQFTAFDIAIKRGHRDLALKLLDLSDEEVKNRLIDNLTPTQKKDFFDRVHNELEYLEECIHEIMETWHFDGIPELKIEEPTSNEMLVQYNIDNIRELEHSLHECASALKKE